MKHLLGTALLVASLVAVASAQVTHPGAVLTVARTLTRTGQTFSVGALHFTADKGSDFEKLLAAKVGHVVTVTVR